MSNTENSSITFRAEEGTSPSAEPEYTGKSVSYYSVEVVSPVNPNAAPYVAECNDIIEALDLSFAEGNILKALWRRAAARKGRLKKGYRDGLYDAEKLVFFSERELVKEMQRAAKAQETASMGILEGVENPDTEEPSKELVAAAIEMGLRHVEEEEHEAERKELREKAYELYMEHYKQTAVSCVPSFDDLHDTRRAYWLNEAREYFAMAEVGQALPITDGKEPMPQGCTSKPYTATSLCDKDADVKKM